MQDGQGVITHFVGIGGAGMSALAHLLLESGKAVSGSDLKLSPVTDRLGEKGAVIFQGHDVHNLAPGVGRVIVSSAIPPGNPEVEAARSRGLPILKRAQLLAELMRERVGIAVAGAHGKTTTTSMLALVLERNCLDPTVVIGGELKELGGSARLGRGAHLVAEADESDGSFLELEPDIIVVTNVENDHLDHYGTMESIVRAFREFVGRVGPEGLAVLCVDDPELRRLAGEAPVTIITYGLGEDAYLRATEICLDGNGSRAEVLAGTTRLGRLELKVPGRHNISNALAVIAVANYLGMPFPGVARALAAFGGANRRFQLMGEAGGIRVVDDYAHHPSEVRVTLQAARQVSAGGRVLVAFQPHRYTRTHHLHREFGASFREADLVVLLDIYSAGERPIPGVEVGLIQAAIAEQGGPPVLRARGLEEAAEVLAGEAAPGDLVLTMGAGDVYRVGENLLANIGKRGR